MEKVSFTNEQKKFLDFLNSLNHVEFKRKFVKLGFILRIYENPAFTLSKKRVFFSKVAYLEGFPVNIRYFTTKHPSNLEDEIIKAMKEKIVKRKITFNGKKYFFELKNKKILLTPC